MKMLYNNTVDPVIDQGVFYALLPFKGRFCQKPLWLLGQHRTVPFRCLESV